MFYCTALLLLAATADVFGHSIRKIPQVGIIGGDPVPISEVPYMAELRLFDGEHVCGASIIHERFVLTAAHCCKFYASIYQVAVGTDNVRTGDTYGVEKMISNERFSLESAEYDIALVKLNKSIIFGPNVTNVTLAAEDFELKTGMVLNTAGWGRTEVEGKNSDTLRGVIVEFVSQSECAEIYSKNSPHNITDKMICAGADGKGGCHGDSGGPLTWNNVQVGITSWGKRCGQYPGVYTKVSVYSSWIKDTIASNI